MPYYSPISEQAAYCWHQCIRFFPRQFGETLEYDMTYFLDVLYSNISTSLAEEFENLQIMIYHYISKKMIDKNSLDKLIDVS